MTGSSAVGLRFRIGQVMGQAGRYWLDARRRYFDFVPRDLFEQTIWRGRKIGEIFPVSGFGFWEDNSVSRSSPALPGASRIEAIMTIMKKSQHEFSLYWKREGRQRLGMLVRGLNRGTYGQ